MALRSLRIEAAIDESRRVHRRVAPASAEWRRRKRRKAFQVVDRALPETARCSARTTSTPAARRASSTCGRQGTGEGHDDDHPFLAPDTSTVGPHAGVVVELASREELAVHAACSSMSTACVHIQASAVLREDMNVAMLDVGFYPVEQSGQVDRTRLGEATSRPFLNAISVGMPRMPNRAATSGSSSVLSLARRTFGASRAAARPRRRHHPARPAPGRPEVDHQLGGRSL